MLGRQQCFEGLLSLGLGLHEALQPLVEFLRRDFHMFTEGGFGLILALGGGLDLGGQTIGALNHKNEAEDDGHEEGEEDVKLRGHDQKVDTPNAPSRFFPILKP